MRSSALSLFRRHKGLPWLAQWERIHPPRGNEGDADSILRWGGRYLRRGNGKHSSIVAQKIPWTEEPGGLQSIGSQRVGHD